MRVSLRSQTEPASPRLVLLKRPVRAAEQRNGRAGAPVICSGPVITRPAPRAESIAPWIRAEHPSERVAGDRRHERPRVVLGWGNLRTYSSVILRRAARVAESRPQDHHRSGGGDALQTCQPARGGRRACVAVDHPPAPFLSESANRGSELTQSAPPRRHRSGRRISSLGPSISPLSTTTCALGFGCTRSRYIR